MVVHENYLLDVSYIIIEVAIAVLAILGNILVCWAVYINSNLQNATNFFVVSLAAADIAVGVLAIPFAITISTGFCASFYGCLFIACFVLVLTQSSIFSLLAIAVDRYIAIKIPLRYNSLVTTKRAKGVIVVCWVLSFIIGLTPMLGWHQDPKVNKEPNNCTLDPICNKTLVICLFTNVVTMDYMVYYNFFVFVLLPLIFMLGIYLKIFMAARQQLKKIELKIIHGEKSRSILQKEVHAAKSLAIIVGLFAVCWLPLHILNCFTLFCPGCKVPPSWLMYMAIILSHANSVVNPLIYAYRIREFRHTFRRILRRHIWCQKEQLLRSNSTKNSICTNVANSTVRINGYVLNIYTNSDISSIQNSTDVTDMIKDKDTPDELQNGTAVDSQPMEHVLESLKNGEVTVVCKNVRLLQRPQEEDVIAVHACATVLEKNMCTSLTEVS
ncbi:adenosine receptor A2a [Protopterus annectens]|uniref:adenosine receptor A2a n=1 Tax=Protopterus annectens TaxID=7888 RepID=UPI001CF97471|nr:adenosine receptor A2a [Protopterus annectens]XP_043924763.1 adenosine receptor A2a [Protopterus annectens]